MQAIYNSNQWTANLATPVDMSNSGDVAQLYKNVIEEVIKNVRNDFVNMGVDEQLWEQKLLEIQVFNAQDFPITTARDYHQTGFFYPSATNLPGSGMHVIPPPHPTVVQASIPGRPYAVPFYAPNRPVVSAMVQIPSHNQPFPHQHTLPSLPSAAGIVPPQNIYLPPPNVAPPLKSAQSEAATDEKPETRELAPDNNDELDETSSKRSKVGGDSTLVELPSNLEGKHYTPDKEIIGPPKNEDKKLPFEKTSTPLSSSSSKPVPSTNNISSTESQVGSTPPTVKDLENGGDELGSDLDDEDDDVVDAVDDNVTDLALCQYEKITRVRNRWRGVLRAGIVHINGRDYCFSRANMDFDW